MNDVEMTLRAGDEKPVIKRRQQWLRCGRAGDAGLAASIGMAVAGALVGAFAAYAGARGAGVFASAPAERIGAAVQPMAPPATPRDRVVERIVAGAPPVRFVAPELQSIPPRVAPPRPKIYVVLDDMGVDPVALDRVLRLPGPLTLSFLPYAGDVAHAARRASVAGAEVMLHLPMEPVGDADPGPYALRLDMTGRAFLDALEWNLGRFDGYAGVNNHMGSALTANDAAMKTVLAYLAERNLFFLDSVTTGKTVAREAGAAVGAKVVSRDVFIDAAVGDPRAVRRQLRLVEEIARETGYAVAIGHPRGETLDVLGPWLATAPARGFDLAPISDLVEREKARDRDRIATRAPALRL